MRALNIVLFLFALQTSFASGLNPEIAEVVKLRGKATHLRPGAMTANKLSIGDRLKEDSSVVTEKRSFVAIRFVDGSKVNLGPKSKLVITKMTKKEAGILSLLKGKMRTKVQKDSNKKKNKLFVRTRSAAMGVRGTEFQTIYNPDNKVTSLLTYKGKVAMVKTEAEDLALGEDSEKKIDRPSRTELEVGDAPKLAKTDVEEMNRLMEQKRPVIVENGQFSGTIDKLGNVSQPVKISPIQLGILYRNDEFSEKKVSRIKTANLENLDKNPFELKQASQEAPPEGFLDEKTGEYAPKAGGVLDIETGLYIPPGKDSEFDPKRGVYVIKDIGDVDKDTGQYKAPKGLVLDSNKGFIVDKKKAGDKELQAKAELLNSNAATDLILATPEVEERSNVRVFTPKERFAKESLYISLKGFSHHVRTNNDPLLGSRDAEKSGQGLHLLWNHATGSRWQLLTGLGIDFIDIGDRLGIAQKSDKLVDARIGFRYNMTPRWNFVASLSVDQDLFIGTSVENNVNSQDIAKVANTKLGLGFEGNLIMSSGGRFSLDTELEALVNPKKEAAGFNVKAGFGFEAKLLASYWFTSKFQGRLGPWVSIYDRGLEGVGAANAFKADSKVDSAGLELSFGYLF